MTSRICILVYALLAMLGILAGVLRANDSDSAKPGFAGSIIKRIGISPQFGKKLPLDAVFVNADGQKVRLAECFHDRPVVLHLVYYECPMLCKLSADGLLSTVGVLGLELGTDYDVVTISFDPREGPAMSARAREMAIARCGNEPVDRGWQFLTGSENAIRSVTETVGFKYEWDDATKQYAHASGAFVLTADGTISRYLGGINFAPRDLRFALVEASDGKVGSLGDQVMMLCYMYDPLVGRYGFAIITIVRAAGILTVVLLGSAIMLMIRREKNFHSQRLADAIDDAVHFDGARR